MSARRKIRIFRVRADNEGNGIGSSQIVDSGSQEVHAQPSLLSLKKLLLFQYANQLARLCRYQPREGDSAFSSVLEELRNGEEPMLVLTQSI